MFEVLTLGADRSTAHAITEWSWVGAPSSTTAFGEVFTSRVASPVSTTKTGAETAVLWSAPTGSKTALYSDTFLYGALPANFYTAAARVEVSIDGETTWQTVVGRQSPITRTQGDGAQPPTHSIRISNGLVRMLVAEGMLRLEVYDSGAAAWEAKRFQLTGAGSTMTALTLISVPVTILRNDPCAATIRLWFGSLGGAGVAVGYCDLTVRRGSWVVEGYANAMDANEALGIRCNTDEAGTSVTGGIDATSADASGNKYQLRSPSAITAETTKGGIYLTSAAQTFPFAVATDKFTGDNTTSPSTSGLYFAAMNHRQRIVAR